MSKYPPDLLALCRCARFSASTHCRPSRATSTTHGLIGHVFAARVECAEDLDCEPLSWMVIHGKVPVSDITHYAHRSNTLGALLSVPVRIFQCIRYYFAYQTPTRQAAAQQHCPPSCSKNFCVRSSATAKACAFPCPREPLPMKPVLRLQSSTPTSNVRSLGLRALQHVLDRTLALLFVFRLFPTPCLITTNVGLQTQARRTQGRGRPRGRYVLQWPRPLHSTHYLRPRALYAVIALAGRPPPTFNPSSPKPFVEYFTAMFIHPLVC